MSSSTARPDGFDISADWFRRDRVEYVALMQHSGAGSIHRYCRVVKLGIAEIVGFLSNFDNAVTTKLAQLNSRLEGLEANLSCVGVPSSCVVSFESSLRSLSAGISRQLTRKETNMQSNSE